MTGPGHKSEVWQDPRGPAPGPTSKNWCFCNFNQSIFLLHKAGLQWDFWRQTRWLSAEVVTRKTKPSDHSGVAYPQILPVPCRLHAGSIAKPELSAQGKLCHIQTAMVQITCTGSMERGSGRSSMTMSILKNAVGRKRLGIAGWQPNLPGAACPQPRQQAFT